MPTLDLFIAAASWLGGTIVAIVVAVMLGLAVLLVTLWLLVGTLSRRRNARSRDS